MGKKVSGVITALITPFRNGLVDYESLKNLVQSQLQGGIKGFVVHGTTGESPTVHDQEREGIFRFIQGLVPPEFLLIVGTGTNCTQTTCELTKTAENWGASAALVVVPYYNKPSQRGLLAHFNSVADASKLPLILYNVPSRTVTSLEVATIKDLQKHPKIIGIKEATGNLEFARQIRKECGDGFIMLSGDDATADQFQREGGDGVISVASHIIPRQMQELKTEQYLALVDLLFCESNPAPVKAALKMMGVIFSDELRLPLVQISDSNRARISEAMMSAGLIK